MAAFFVELDESRHLPGNTLKGKVICIFDRAEETTGIEIEVKGEESTKWVEQSYEGKGAEDVSYTGYNELLSKKVQMPGVHFQPGNYAYEFSYKFGKKTPGSYYSVDQKNSVAYYVKATINRAQEKTPTVIFKTFYVTSQVDLNNVKRPHRKLTKNETGPVKLNVLLDKDKFLVGETVGVVVNILNPRKIPVDKVTAELGMNIETTVTTPTVKVNTYYTPLDIKETCPKDSTKPGNKCTERCVLYLDVPQDAFVPNFVDCKLFRLFPVVKVTAKIPNYHDVVQVFPIMLGHCDSSGKYSILDSFSDTYYDDDISLTMIHLPANYHITTPIVLPSDPIIIPDTNHIVTTTTIHHVGHTEVDSATTPLLHSPNAPPIEHTSVITPHQVGPTDIPTATTPLLQSTHPNPPSIDHAPIIHSSVTPILPNVATTNVEDVHIITTGLVLESSNHVSAPPIDLTLATPSPMVLGGDTGPVDDLHLFTTGLLLETSAPVTTQPMPGDLGLPSHDVFSNGSGHGGGAGGGDDSGDCCDCGDGDCCDCGDGDCCDCGDGDCCDCGDCDCGDCDCGDCDCGDADCDCGDADCGDCGDCVIL